MKKLSIITVCLNEVNNIEKTVRSVVNQCYTDIEYIIIDGASTDGTLDIIERYKNDVDILISEKDSGIYNAMNKGLQAASGEYVAFVNAGDYLFSDLVYETAFSNSNSEDIIYGDIVVILQNGLRIRKRVPKKLSELYMLSDTVPHPGTIIKRKLIEEAGLYNESYRIAADYDFFVNALFKQKSSYTHVDIPFSVFNSLGISSDKKSQALNSDERIKIQKTYFSSEYLDKTKVKSLMYKSFVKYPSYLMFLLQSKLNRKNVYSASEDDV